MPESAMMTGASDVSDAGHNDWRGPGDACPDTDLSDTRGHNKVTGIMSSSFVENIQGSF